MEGRGKGEGGLMEGGRECWGLMKRGRQQWGVMKGGESGGR